MGRFTIELPADLTGTTSGRNERTGTTGSRRASDGHDARNRTDLDAATAGFVSWVDCWAGA